MLHCAGDTTGDIQLRPHRLTGLADLVFIGDQPGVHDLTGHAHSAAQYLGQLLDHCNALLRRHTGAGCDHDIRIIHGGRIFLLQIIQDFGQHGSLAGLILLFHDFSFPLQVRGKGLHHLGPYRGHLGPGAGAEQAGIQISAEGGAGLDQQAIVRLAARRGARERPIAVADRSSARGFSSLTRLTMASL